MTGDQDPNTKSRRDRLRSLEEIAESDMPASDEALLISANQTARSLDSITRFALWIYAGTCVVLGAFSAIEGYQFGVTRGLAAAFEVFKIAVLPILTLVIGLYTGRTMRGG